MQALKRILLTGLFAFPALGVQAQYAASLNENFDVACAFSTGFPASWLNYNTLSGTYPMGAWHCDPANGRKTITGTPTPGMECTGVWSGAYHLDTSYLLTPRLFLGGIPHIYLHFDTKADSITLGGKISVLITNDTGAGVGAYAFGDSTSTMAPAFGISDSAGWVTHEVDLSLLATPPGGGTPQPFFIAFRYISSAISGSIWFLDNVNTSTTRLYAPDMDVRNMPLTIIGRSYGDQVNISFSTPYAMDCQLGIYDMLGRELHKEILNTRGGFETYSIKDLHLNPGMYFLKMGNGIRYGAVKVIVQ